MPIELKALVLGIVEGLTEFLPVSSTGHLLLTMSALRVDEQAGSWQVFLYFIQIGAVLAIFAMFGRRILRLWTRLLAKLVVALLPSVVVGLLFDRAVEAHLERPATIATALIAGAILMIFVERSYRRVEGTPIDQVGYRQAVVIGLAQCVSIIPGTSRAMATILGGMIAGLTPAAAVEFSFYLAVPTILGATVLKLRHYAGGLTGEDYRLLAIGFVAALGAALLVVRWFLRYVSRERMTRFALYRVVIGVATFILSMAGAFGSK